MGSPDASFPTTGTVRARVIFIEPTAAAQTAETTFEIVDQGSRRVGIFARWGKAGTEMDIVINWGGTVGGVRKV